MIEWTCYAGSGDLASLGMAVTIYGGLPVAAPTTWNTAVQSAAAAHTASVTTQAANSLVIGATVNSAAVVTPAGTASNGTVTVDQNQVDTPNNGGYSAQSCVTSVAGATVSLGVSDSAAGGAAVVEVPLSAAPTPPVCLGYVSSVSGDSTSTASGLPWSFPGATGAETLNEGATLGNGQYVFAAVSAMGAPTGGQVAMTLTDSYGLQWTELVAANTAGNNYAGVWVGINPAGPLTAPPDQTLMRAVKGRPYSTSLRSPGGWGPILWSVAQGSTMPTGLYLYQNGQVAGTAMYVGTWPFRCVAVDQLGNRVTSGTYSVPVVNPT